MERDTIAAISTAAAPSGIAIVRISGEQAIQIADRIYAGPKGKRLADQNANTVHYGMIRKADERTEILDEVLVMLLRAPHSYTGEDTVEIDCHGGMLVASRILEEAVSAGARPAEPGEFTKRAFLNGRIDLSQAEAVMDLISAKSEAALRVSLRQLKGSLSGEIGKIRSSLLHEMAYIEASLDDPEHIDIDEHMEDFKKVIRENQENITSLLSRASEGRFIKEGIKTVILGKPNAGKSSLLNALAGEEKAIVTDIAGTTRDIIENNITVGGVMLNLLDTAGIREADDRIEQIGVARAWENAEEADLILYVADSSVSLDENDRQIMERIRGRNAVVLLNKNDLVPVLSEEELQSETDRPVISISAKNRSGIDQLEKEISRMFFAGDLRSDAETYITNVRHQRALADAENSLKLVEESVMTGMPADFWSIDLADACDALGQITGQTLREDLVNEIFSSFCMGK